MRRYRNQIVGVMIGLLSATGSTWAGEATLHQTDKGINAPYDSGVVQLYGDSPATGAGADFGRIQLYQFTSPPGNIQSGTIYRFGSPQGYAPLQGITPMIPGPPMRTGPLIPMVPLVPLLPGGELAPVVPNIGVITPGPAPGTSTWGHGR